VGQRANIVKIGNQIASNATLQVTNGWLAVTDEVVIGVDPAASAVLELTGGELSTVRLSRGASGSFSFIGGRLRAEYIDFDVVNLGGELSPGRAISTLTISGLYSQSAASAIKIEIGGLSKGVDHDVVSVLNTMTISGGSLDVSFANGFLPTPGDEFDVLDFVQFSGQFSTLNLPGGNAVWNTTRLSLDGVLRFVGYVGGDYNSDGRFDCQDIDNLVAEIASGNHAPSYDITSDGLVDQHDLALWLTNAGAINLASGNAYLPGDANLDGAVDGSDFNLWNSHKFTMANGWCGGDFSADGFTDGSDFGLWNSHKFQSSASIAVPEACGTALASACGVVWVFRSIKPTRHRRFLTRSRRRSTSTEATTPQTLRIRARRRAIDPSTSLTHPPRDSNGSV
jgi:hypothetical protein